MANDNNNPEFVIRVKTLVDEPTFQRAVQAQEDLARATNRNIELAKQQTAQVQAATGGNTGSATPLADAFMERVKASGALTKEMSALKGEAAAASGSVESLATGALPKLASGMAIAGAAIAALKGVFDTMLANNAELAESWEGLKDTVGKSWSDTVKDVIGNGDGLKKWFDDWNRTLGGTTTAQQDVNKAVSEFVRLGDQQKTIIEKVTGALKDQAEAAKIVRDRMKTLYADEDAQKQATRESEDKDRKAAREAIQQDPNLSPEEKADRLKSFDRESGAIDRTRRRDDVRTSRERQAADLKVSQQEVNAAEELAKKQTETVAKLRGYQAAAAGAAQARQRGDSADAASLEKQQRAAFDALPKDLREGLMNIDAEAQKATAAGGDAKEIAAKQEKDRKALIDQQAKAAEDARKAAAEAVKKRNELAEKQTQDDAKNKLEEARLNDEDQRAAQQEEQDKQTREQQRREGQQERNLSKAQEDDIAKATRELREAGKSGNRGAVAKAQARLREAKAAQAAKAKADAASGAELGGDEPADDDVFAYDNDGNPILYSDLTPEERKAAKAEAKQAAAEDGGSGGDNRRRSRGGRSRDEFQRGNGATMAAGPTTSSGPRSGSNRAASSAGATSPFSSGLSMVGTTPGEAGEISRVGPTSGIAPAKNAISEAMDAFSEAMNSLGALAGHMKRSHQGHALAIGEALAAMQTVSITQAMAAKDFRKIKTQVGAVIASENPVAP